MTRQPILTVYGDGSIGVANGMTVGQLMQVIDMLNRYVQTLPVSAISAREEAEEETEPPHTVEDE